jgi:hypothetical protein
MNKDSKSADNGEEGPLWNLFWNKTFPVANPLIIENNIEDGLSQGSAERLLTPSASASQRISVSQPPIKQMLSESSAVSVNEQCNQPIFSNLFPFKLKDSFTPNVGNVFRFSSNWNSLKDLIVNINLKTGSKCNFPISSDYIFTDCEKRLGYIDDDGDYVPIENDCDLEEAVLMTKRCLKKHLVVYLCEQSSILELNSSRVTSTSIKCNNEDVSSAGVVNVVLAVGIVLVTYYLMSKIKRW